MGQSFFAFLSLNLVFFSFPTIINKLCRKTNRMIYTSQDICMSIFGRQQQTNRIWAKFYIWCDWLMNRKAQTELLTAVLAVIRFWQRQKCRLSLVHGGSWLSYELGIRIGQSLLKNLSKSRMIHPRRVFFVPNAFQILRMCQNKVSPLQKLNQQRSALRKIFKIWGNFGLLSTFFSKQKRFPLNFRSKDKEIHRFF